MTADFYHLVQKLTREHDVTVTTDDGPRFVKTDGLLELLRQEILGGAQSGGAARNVMRLPLNAPAVDLYTLIDRQIAEVWGNAFNRIPNADRAEALLAEWAAFIGSETIVTYSTPETIKKPAETVIWVRNECTATNLLRRWVHAIEELFNPPSHAEILAACIQCGEREVWRPKDGELVPQTALVFVRDRETGDSIEARCQACGMTWPKTQFKYLAEAITANESLRHANVNTG